jgi:hypothetical protein
MSNIKKNSLQSFFPTILGLTIFACLAFSAVAYIVEWDPEGVDYLTKRRKLEGPRLEHHEDVGDALDEYMAKGMPDIIGWLELQALLVIRVISSHQIDQGVRGGVAEIGVHHGKFFAALCLLNSDSGTEAGVAIAIDVFEVTPAA